MSPAASGLLFGTAGVPLSSADASTLTAIEHVRELGLDCLEVEFVKGIKMGRDTAAAIGERARRLDVRLSVHAPYYVNLNSEDRAKRLLSQERLLKSARLAAAMGARSVVFHAGFYGKESAIHTYAAIRSGLAEVMSVIRTERVPVTMRVETMGKRAQFGSFDEVLQLCRDVEGLQPCLDFSHIYAREGRVNSYPEFERVLAKVAKKLGAASLRNLHIHVAGVEYNQTGELKHLNLQESDFRYDEWLRALREAGAGGMVICESPNLEADAVMLKDLYLAQVVKH